jgi:hypothetical protein
VLSELPALWSFDHPKGWAGDGDALPSVLRGPGTSVELFSSRLPADTLYGDRLPLERGGVRGSAATVGGGVRSGASIDAVQRVLAAARIRSAVRDRSRRAARSGSSRLEPRWVRALTLVSKGLTASVSPPAVGGQAAATDGWPRLRAAPAGAFRAGWAALGLRATSLGGMGQLRGQTRARR